MSSGSPPDAALLLPNLGAEEGDDWKAYREQPAVRSAAHLWCLLFGRSARLRTPADAAGREWQERRFDTLWPEALGKPPSDPVFRWLASASGPTAWLNSESLARSTLAALDQDLAGAPAGIVRAVHDKAFASEAAGELGLAPRSLLPLVEVLEPEALASQDALLGRLDRALSAWPEWTGRRFTFKPRFGSSGRGRVGGHDRVDTPVVRGALPRLAERGGAIFEPWLDRLGDFSVSLHVPPREQPDALPTLLGSLEMWASPSGVYRGHCGEVDSRGRVFSGDPEDESMRANAAAVASLARARGFAGPCGVDSFRYREATADGERERMRGSVEFNARMTMGLVTIGVVRRALPLVREALELSPGDRRGFALTFRTPDDDPTSRLRAALGASTQILDLSTGHDPDDPRPLLVFARELAPLRDARRELFDC